MCYNTTNKRKIGGLQLIFSSSSVTETEKIGADLGKKLIAGSFVALYGDLGAGKTAFVRGAVSVLCENAAVCSPTYAVVNRYDGRIPVYHFDLYRINDDDDLYSTGYYDILEEKAIFFCEWCEKCPEAIPDGAIKVTITRTENGRRIEIADIIA